MMMNVSSLEYLLKITNDTLTAIIAIVAISILLYNLTRNLNSRIARTSSILLACVTVVSAIDVLTSLNLSIVSLQVWLRVQWLGIAFAPAAMFHLSHTLLATTGLASRGRRRRIVRRLYYLSILFLILALFTDAMIYGIAQDPAPHLLAGTVFGIYIVYFIIATIVSLYNVQRARQRCRTTYSNRRMGYLLYSFTLPALGIFPFSLLFPDSSNPTLLFWIVVNIGSVGLLFTLVFLSYPLSSFGSDIPDRIVQSELLRFFLRGPITGVLVLLVIVYLPQAGRVLGLPGDEFMPFAAVVVVMFWQWSVSLSLPYLERRLIYSDDMAQVQMVQDINNRLLTQRDLKQLFEAILASACDLLQSSRGFLVSFDGDQVHLREMVGPGTPGDYGCEGAKLLQTLRASQEELGEIIVCETFWTVALYSNRLFDEGNGNGNGKRRLLGALAVQARSDEVNLSSEEERVFHLLVEQAAQAFDDRLLQQEVFAALEGLLPEMEAIQRLRDAARYGAYPMVIAETDSDTNAIDAKFVNNVRDALRDYWGGPRLTQSPLLQMGIVNHALPENDNSPTRALRMILLDAIEQLRPEGERSMTQAEWTLYNIVELRFVKGIKVKDVAKRMAISEADLYRKQRAAIEEVARVLLFMERTSLENEMFSNS